ncbi:MAG: YMGG-like glycine zipper-containing protein [Terriglobia bacterium]
MLKSFGVTALMLGSLVPAAVPAQAVVYHQHPHHRRHVRTTYYRRGEAHPVRKTVKRVGLGAAGGALVGGIAGGGTGAAIGALAGGGAGAVYDHHEKKIGK